MAVAADTPLTQTQTAANEWAPPGLGGRHAREWPGGCILPEGHTALSERVGSVAVNA